MKLSKYDFENTRKEWSISGFLGRNENQAVKTVKTKSKHETSGSGKP